MDNQQQTKKAHKSERFIKDLQNHAEDRGLLAALRRGVGKVPGSEPNMYPYMMKWVANEKDEWREATYFMIAALFAFHPQSTNKNENLGHHYAQAGENEANERRFITLLNAPPDILYRYLNHAIRFLKTKEILINWQQLFWDISNWEDPDTRLEIQRKWGKGYWGTFETQKQAEDNA